MRCSVCSHVVRPLVAVDIDGTLGDYHGHFTKFAMAYLGVPDDEPIHPYNGRGTFRQWFCDTFEQDERTWRDIKLAYRQGAQKRSMPIRDGAATVCKLIRSAGAELWLTTTRPYLRLDNIDPDTRAWLQRHGIIYDGLLYDEFKYKRLAEIVDKERVVAVVDDLEEMWDAAAAVFGWRIPILMRGLYNRAVRSEADAKSFNDLWQQVHKRIQQWEITHGDERSSDGSSERHRQGSVRDTG